MSEENEEKIDSDINLNDIENLYDNSESLEILNSKFKSIQDELVKLNRQLEVISESYKDKNNEITIGHFSIGIFCVCLAVIFF